MVSLTYEPVVDTDADDHKVDLLHQDVRKYETIYDTVAEATRPEGLIIRRSNARS